MPLAEVRENETPVHVWSKKTGENWTEVIPGLGTASMKGIDFLEGSYP